MAQEGVDVQPVLADWASQRLAVLKLKVNLAARNSLPSHAGVQDRRDQVCTLKAPSKRRRPRISSVEDDSMERARFRRVGCASSSHGSSAIGHSGLLQAQRESSTSIVQRSPANFPGAETWLPNTPPLQPLPVEESRWSPLSPLMPADEADFDLLDPLSLLPPLPPPAAPCY
eukprot:CAMPEP_0119329632 /NCGR_PEP_ID=MMETSP1333-20130426/76314_1 /TAXON_ID=418940 /ORGANISM="Scyphosphaera apsteinii, Strain RCC1455" /LENGTH=171 /DNA_ID=CAMNT_0007338799 /DNA_START=39 /DNA_END=554 /DNA_ORIENTATION=+